MQTPGPCMARGSAPQGETASNFAGAYTVCRCVRRDRRALRVWRTLTAAFCRLQVVLKAEKTYNIVFVTSEVTPWSKTGGLADVAGALPQALVKRGHRVMVRYQCQS